MKKQRFGLFRRIYAIVFLLIALLGLLFMGVTYLATTSFYAASTQLLNKDVASHIAKFTSPYGKEGFDRQKADSVFYQAMVISPSAEVYFLDTAGRVIYFHGDTSEIHSWQVDIRPLQRYIESGGLHYMSGPDPRDPDHPKIFSAAGVEGEKGKLGYIYVILGNQQYRSVTQMLLGSRVTPTVLVAVILILALSLLITLWYVGRFRRRFDDMMGVLEKFRAGDFTARFEEKDKDELGLVTDSFNNLADLLLDNINRVTASEKERRDFMVNVSHDLRTPLAIARGYAETLLLKKGQLSAAEEKEYGELVVGKMRQVEKMVGQLFELSKMESASFEMRREPFVFSEVLQEIVGAVGVKVECRNCTDGAYVLADISMMERVIQNLVVNARDYGRGRVVIALTRVGGDGGGRDAGGIRDGGEGGDGGADLVFRIENEGEPLSKEMLQWINGDGLRPKKPAIGLAIVKKILFLHGFAFRAEVAGSPEMDGKINMFYFTMPIYSGR